MTPRSRSSARSPAPAPSSGPATVLELGNRSYDVSTRALIMGILNRTPDSFFDQGRFFGLDRLVDRAAELVRAGADLLDIGGVKAGPGPEVPLGEELERVVPAIEAVTARFDVPVSVDTWNAEVARASYSAGAVVGNDISGFADPGYLEAAAAAGASVVATHIRLGPRIPDPEPHYADLVGEVNAFLLDRADRARAAGIPAARIMLDAGLDLGKTWAQSLVLLRATGSLAAMGYPVLLSASNKTFLGKLLDLEVDQRGTATVAACSLGTARGARVLRVHDVRAVRRARDTIDAILRARA